MGAKVVFFLHMCKYEISFFIIFDSSCSFDLLSKISIE